jgi:hypothetical protein
MRQTCTLIISLDSLEPHDYCDSESVSVGLPSNIEHELQAKVAQPLRMQGV